MTITPVEHEPTRYWVESQSTPGVTHLVDLADGDKRFTWQYQQMHTFGREGVIVRIEAI
jgi:hypothetical protein